MRGPAALPHQGIYRVPPRDMQIRVKLVVLNENAAKHLHLNLDPCQSHSRHMGSTPRKIYSVKISDPNKRDAKDKTDDRKGTVFSCELQLNHTGLQSLVHFRISYDSIDTLSCFSPKIHLQDL